MKIARLWLLVIAAAAVMPAQSWDTSGNGMLTGKYYFRQVLYVIGDDSGDLSEAVALYGNIEFDGNGNYTITAADNSVYIDVSGSGSSAGALVTTGTYSISASGYGFISSPYVTGDQVYGLVGSQGIFVASSTENGNGYNDMMVAAPVASPLPTASSFTGSWVAADFDLSSGSPSEALSMTIPMSPDGNGNLNAGTIVGYSGVSATPYQQLSSGLKYIFSNGAAVATFPNTGTLVAGQKYLYFSPDGKFMFGGSPYTSATPFDMIVGVKASTTPTLSGLYYQAGLDEFEGDLDSYYGSFNVIAGAAPQTFLGHERLNTFGGSADSSVGGGVEDYTYSDTISLSGTTYTNTYAKYIVGDGGAVEITSGIGPYLGLSVAIQAACPVGTTATGTQGQCSSPTSGVYINPTGVVNAASDAPYTASLAPGELLTLYGSNLAASTVVAPALNPPAFPTTLGNVQVSIGGLPAPIYYVSPTQVSAIVPYGVTIGSVADIQVTNNGTLSNIVTNYVGATAPGVFTQNQNGTGFGAIEHLGVGNTVSPAYSVVTAANPAIPGETIAVYLTGLGAVTPTITDGTTGSSTATNTITADFNGTAATVTYAGLAPCCSGLYQLNVTVPSLTTADPIFWRRRPGLLHVLSVDPRRSHGVHQLDIQYRRPSRPSQDGEDADRCEEPSPGE